jgi:hypothetical protein
VTASPRIAESAGRLPRAGGSVGATAPGFADALVWLVTNPTRLVRVERMPGSYPARPVRVERPPAGGCGKKQGPGRGGA